MQTLRSTLINFQAYIRHPKYVLPLTNQSGNQVLKTARQFLAEYPMLLGLLVLSVGTILMREYVIGEDIYKPLIQRYSSSIGLLFIALVLAVIAQEAVFRAILRLTPNRLRNIAAFLLCVPLVYFYHLINDVAGESAILGLIIVWGTVTYLLNLYLKRPTVFLRIHNFWQANFRWVFYAIALLYALDRIINNVGMLTGWQLLFFPVLLLVGLLSGFYFGYIRMKYGFWYAVAVHTLLLASSLVPEMIYTL